MNGQTKIKLSLNIGIQGEQEDTADLEELVPDWTELSDEELAEALHKAWIEWAWQYIDGCAQIAE